MIIGSACPPTGNVSYEAVLLLGVTEQRQCPIFYEALGTHFVPLWSMLNVLDIPERVR